MKPLKFAFAAAQPGQAQRPVKTKRLLAGRLMRTAEQPDAGVDPVKAADYAMQFARHEQIVSASPHVRSHRGIPAIMRDVLIALAPAAIAGAIIQGPLRTDGFAAWQPFLILLCAVLSAVAAEWAMQKLLHRPITVRDLSAAVTGLLLGMNLPATVPLWVPVVGSVFAIAVVKQLFGGLGYNFINPALGARAFLMACWPALMTAFPGIPESAGGLAVLAPAADAISSSTPLNAIAAGSFDGLAQSEVLRALLLGTTGGCIGEGCRLLLIAGGVYLLVRRVITWHIPVVYVASYILFDRLFGNTAPIGYMVFSGGLILGALFMATDYVTNPETRRSQMIFALGCGLCTAAIRCFGGYPEGVSYSILLMNLTVPLLSKLPGHGPFGGRRKHAKA